LAPAPELLIHDDADTAIVAAARDVAARVRDAVAARGGANVAFSGGSAATRLFEALAVDDVPWPAVHVFQVDERVAPDGDDDRNAVVLQSSLAARVRLPAANLHLMPVTAPDLDAAAADYGRMLPRLDVVHLGVGEDGHTASWPPGDPVIGECDRPVSVVGPFNGRLRMTITPGVVEDARAIVVLVVGESKRQALARMLAGDPDVPASHVPFRRTVVHADRAAIATTPDH
jgi:6-phosphogluconolactonase